MSTLTYPTAQTLAHGRRRFLRFSWFVIFYTVLVILWGAYVRATGSGAGCGRHWPSCNGQVIPRPEQIETWIELSHRITSALLGLLSIAQVFWGFRLYAAGHPVRRAVLTGLGFTIFEGALGAGLVLFELVAGDTSTTRAIVVGLHLVNTMLLVGAFTLIVWWASGGRALNWGPATRTVRYLLGTALIAMLILSAFGAITALGDTLFPAESLSQGLAQKFDPTSHFAVRMRIWHPTFAVFTSAYILWLMYNMEILRNTPAKRQAAVVVAVIIVVQVLGGVLNVLLLAPVVIQMFHLLLSNALWVALLFWTFRVLSEEPENLPIGHALKRTAHAD